MAFTLLFFVPDSGAQISFAENKGQWPEPVRAAADIPGGKLWLTGFGFRYQLFDPGFFEGLHPAGKPAPDSMFGHVYDIRFLNADFRGFSGEKEKSFYLNYFTGASPASWATRVRSYEACSFRNIYPGVDLRYHTANGALKYDFIVRKKGDPGLIRWTIDGADHVTVENGAIHIRTSVGSITEKAPFAYQIIQGKIREVSCSYHFGNGEFSFDLGDYHPDYDLIIDPEVAFSTFIGSTASNFGFTACNDSEDNLLGGAAVFNAGYPTTAGAFSASFIISSANYMDMAISKFSADGTQLLYSTYVGGNLQETPHSIVADAEDNFIVFGVTGSSNFPITPGVFQPSFAGGPNLPMSGFFTSTHPEGCDLFVMKFNPEGSLLHSTFVGGDANDGLNYGDELFYNYGDVFRGEVNVDAEGRVYVASVTQGQFPMNGPGFQQTFGLGFQDGIVFSLDATLSTMLNSTYVGGFDLDACYAVEFEGNGNLIVAGGTKSPDFPVPPGGHQPQYNDGVDGYVLLLDASDLSVTGGTFVATNAYDQVYFVQTDPEGNIYTLGQSRGNMPVSPGCWGQPNSGQFIRKYNGALNTLLWSTTIGRGAGTIDVSPTAFLVSDCNQIFFSGWGGTTNSQTCSFIYDCYATASTTTGMPVSSDAIQPTTDGSDFYLCVLSPDAENLIYASFLGGGQSAEHVDGGTSRFAKNGTVYQSVCAGCQGNSDFPTSPSAWSETNNSTGCNMAVFRFNLGQIEAEVQLEGPSEICEGVITGFLNLSEGGNEYAWDMGDGTELTTFNALHAYQEPGTYTVQLIVHETTECMIGDTASITVTVLPGVDPFITPVAEVCPGTPVQLFATGTENMYWLENDALEDPSSPNPIVVASEDLTLALVDSNFCEVDTLFITVPVFPINISANGPFTVCEGSSVTLTAGGGVAYAWSPPQGLSSTNQASVTASPADSTTYKVVITTTDGCVDSLFVEVNIDLTEIGGTIYDTLQICSGSQVTLPGPSATSWLWTPSAGLSNPNVQFPVAGPEQTTTYHVHITNACAEGTDEITVRVIQPIAIAEGDTVVCEGIFVPLHASGGETFSWQPAAFVPNRFNDTVYVAPPETTLFTVTVTDGNGCAARDSVIVFILPQPEVHAGPDQYFEAPGSVILYGNAFGNEYTWSPDLHISCTDCPYPTVWPQDSLYYTLEVTDSNGCTGRDSVLVVPVYPLYVPNTVTANGDGINDVFRVVGENIRGFHLEIYNRWGDKIFESDDPDVPWIPGLDGYYVQDGVYIWVVEYESIERRKQLIGHVTVLR